MSNDRLRRISWDLTHQDFQLANIAPAFRAAMLASVPGNCLHRVALDQAVSWTRDIISAGKNLVLWGEPRQGKTSAAALVAAESMRWSAKVWFTRADDLVKAVFDKQWADRDSSVSDRAREADLLVLDDVGNEAMSAFGRGVLEQVVRYRLDHVRSTLVTCLSHDNLERGVGGPTTAALLAEAVDIKFAGANFARERLEATAAWWRRVTQKGEPPNSQGNFPANSAGGA